MNHSEVRDNVFEVPLNGVELALLIASDMVNSWPFRLNAPQEKLSESQRGMIRKVSAYLYEARKQLLIAAGVFLPPVTLVPPPEYVSKRATIQSTVRLTREEICTCLAVLRFCQEELSGDPEDWRDFCSISSSSLAYFDLALTVLLDLVGKLGEVLRSGPGLSTVPTERPYSSCGWPPGNAVAIRLNGVEFALLKGSLSFLDGWLFQSPIAQAMFVPSEGGIARSISKYLFSEQQSQLRSAGALAPPALPVPPEFIAMRAVFRSQHILMREHLQVCIMALRVCEEEFREHWVDFCQTAPSGLHHFNPPPEDLPRLTVKLERLLREGTA
jgi:hypothetical protein